MEQKRWTEAELAQGYQAMARLNRELARDFQALEDEAAAWADSQWQAEEDE